MSSSTAGLARLGPIAVVLALSCLTARTASAVVVERVVAVIGDRAVLLSDLRLRARPFLRQLHRRCPIGTPPCLPAENKIYSQLLDRMVDEEIERQAAARASLTIGSEDVDVALRRIARLAGMTVSQLMIDVTQQSGMTETEYRQEIRRQVLEGKLVQRLVQNEVRITNQEVEAMFRTMVEQERRVLLYQPSWIVLRLGKHPGEELLAARTKQAREIVALARAGADFGQLARQFSEDPRTRALGGDLGVRAPASSPYALRGHNPIDPQLEEVAVALAPGEVSEPLRFKDALAIVKLTNRQPSHYGSFEAARPEMIQRVQGEKLEKAKRTWLKDLRKGTHVDVRL